MSVTVTLQRTSSTSIRLAMSSDLGGTPSFHIWRDGRLVHTTTASTWDDAVPVGHAPVYDVFDDPDSEPDFLLPATVSVQWEADPEADHYLVEEYVGSAWVRRARIPESGRGYCRWTSPPLADEAEHRFRVAAVAPDGNASTVTELTHTLVRTPDPPTDVTLTYDPDTGLLTITA